MKNIFSTLTVLFILLTSTVSWGNVDGNGVICEETSEPKWFPYPFFLIFENGMVHHNGILADNDVLITTKGDTVRYTTSPSKISWNIFNTDRGTLLTYTLNRKDLSFEISLNKEKKELQCEVYPTEILIEKINEMLRGYQSEYDKKKKDNKI